MSTQQINTEVSQSGQVNKISITRALTELKTYDSRINKLIAGTSFILCKTKKTNYNVQENEFYKSVQSTYQSINDLIRQRDRLRANILKSNSITIVKIGSDNMTVAEAIERKKTIQYYKTLLATLRNQRATATRDSEAHRDRVQSKIDESCKMIFSSKDATTKIDSSAIKTISDGMWQNDPVDIYDPIKLDKEIEQIDQMITIFESNVDFVLSESNAMTLIEC